MVILSMLGVVAGLGVLAYICDLCANISARSADPLDPWGG